MTIISNVVRAWFVCAFGLCVALSLEASTPEKEHFTHIDTTHIEQLTDKTRTVLLRRRKIRTGVLAAAAVCGMVQAALLVKELADWCCPDDTVSEAGDAEKSSLSWWESFQLEDAWKKGAKSVGMFGIALGANIIYNRLYDRIMRDYVTPESIRWFVKTRAPYYALAAEIRMWCIGLSPDQPASPVIIMPFISAHAAMIEYLERILAYFMFKKEEFSGGATKQQQKKVLVATSLCDRMIGEAAKQREIFEEAIAQEVLDVFAISRGFETLIAVVETCCGQLARLEGSQWFESEELRRNAESGLGSQKNLAIPYGDVTQS